MKQINLYLSNFPQFNFSILPTPIHKLEILSAKYDASVYCMRDDLTGFAFGGNKTRKLDFLVADAKNKGYDTLIGVGANQSNFCRMTAAAGKLAGMEVHLLLSGEKPVKPTANLMLDHLFDAVVHHINVYDNTAVEEESKILEKELIFKGKKVYRMPLGGSTSLGSLGYLKAFNEILNYGEKNHIGFETIFLASGSGGTQAGLVLGQIISQWKGELVGISVGRSADELKGIIKNIVKGGLELLKLPVSPIEINVDERYIGKAYGMPTPEGEEAIKEFATLEGILLDKVYTGKAAAAMLDYIKNNRVKKDKCILFIHTGGNIELFE